MISTKAFAGHRVEITVGIIPERNPFLRKAAIVLVVIKRLKRQPLCCMLGRRRVINALKLNLNFLPAQPEALQCSEKQTICAVCQ